MTDRIARFRELYSQYNHRHGRKREPDWIAAHREMFELAQVLTALMDPNLNTQLQSARRAVARYLEQHHPPEFATDSVMANDRTATLRWQEFQITPEFSLDPALRGLGVPKALSDRLLKAHRQQVRLIMSIVT